MARECVRFEDHELANGHRWATRGCKHPTAENMSRADFRALPHVRCARCRTMLGVVCPDCQRVY